MKRYLGPALIAALTACSGHSGGGIVPSANGPGPGATPQAPVAFSIRIPLAGTGVRAQHVSSATLGVGITTYAQSDGGHTTAIGYFGNDVSPTSPACTTGPVFRVCTIQAAAPAGADEMVVATYDQAPNGSGVFANTAKLLDTGKVDFTVLAGRANSISVTLGGVPAQIAVAIDNPNAIFDATLYAGMPYNVEVSAQDASGATIIGSDPYAAPIALSTSTGNATFTIDGAASTLVTKPDSVVTMVDASTSPGLPTLVATGNGGIIGTANYSVDPIGATTAFASRTGPTAIASGTASSEVGQPGDLFYADANEELVKFDTLTKAESILGYSGATPAALATTAIVQNRFAGVDVSFVTASDGTDVRIGTSDGGPALLGTTVPAASNCAIANAATGSRILACGDTIDDVDLATSSTTAGRTYSGITTGADGRLHYAFRAPAGGGIGSMAPGDIGGPGPDAVIDLAGGHHGTAIVSCPDAALYFIDVDDGDGSTALGEIAAGSLATHAVSGTMTALTCGPNDDLYYGTDDGKIYRVALATDVASLVSSNGGAIAGITLGPDGAIWATDSPFDRILRVIP